MFVEPSASLAVAVTSAAVPEADPSATELPSLSPSVGVETSNSSTSVIVIATVSVSELVPSRAVTVSV